jgi:hypothetical protein
MIVMTKASRGVVMLVALLAVSVAAWGCKGKKDTGPADPAPPGGNPPVAPPQGGFPQGGPPQGGFAPGGGGGSKVKQIMAKISDRNPNSLTNLLAQELKADAPDWGTIQPQTAEYAQLAANLAKTDAPRGPKESWSQLAAAFADSAAALDRAAQAKDLSAARTAREKLGSSCMECHRAHRGGPGGFGPGRRGPGGPPGG